DGAADRRNDVERINLIELVEAGYIDRREFEAKEASADLQHAMRFGERAFDARHVADAEGDGDAIEAAVGIGEFLGVALLESDDVIAPALGGARAADAEHLGIDVADRDARAGAARVRHAERDIAG